MYANSYTFFIYYDIITARKKDMKFFDDKNKNLKWYNRNYFYIGTIIVIVLNILLFAILGNNYAKDIGGHHVWNGVFDISNMLRSFVDVFVHGDWQHVLLNMLCFAFCGIYIERKLGTINFILLILGFSFLAGNITTAARNSVNHYGASGLNYFCYAYITLDYIFCFIQKKQYKTNIILGAIILFCIYVAISFNIDNTIRFMFYPYNLIYNAAHYSSFFAGIIVTLMIKFGQFNKKEK